MCIYTHIYINIFFLPMPGKWKLCPGTAGTASHDPAPVAPTPDPNGVIQFEVLGGSSQEKENVLIRELEMPNTYRFLICRCIYIIWYIGLDL